MRKKRQIQEALKIHIHFEGSVTINLVPMIRIVCTDEEVEESQIWIVEQNTGIQNRARFQLLNIEVQSIPCMQQIASILSPYDPIIHRPKEKNFS